MVTMQSPLLTPQGACNSLCSAAWKNLHARDPPLV